MVANSLRAMPVYLVAIMSPWFSGRSRTLVTLENPAARIACS
jgi:hypothetical protein